MFCWNCGKEMDDDLLFCPHCAMKQAGIPEPKPKRQRKIPVLPLVCIVVCIAVLLGLILMLTASPAPEEPPVVPAETEAPYEGDPDSVELPDLAAFLNTRYDQDEYSAFTHYMACILKKEQGLAVAEEFAGLLQKPRYQLVLDEVRTGTEGENDVTDYLFHYTGENEEIEWIYHKQGYQYHVKLTVYEHAGQDKVTLILYTEPDFELKDPGVTAKALQ